jgi:hypothetical protein
MRKKFTAVLPLNHLFAQALMALILSFSISLAEIMHCDYLKTGYYCLSHNYQHEIFLNIMFILVELLE